MHFHVIIHVDAFSAKDPFSLHGISQFDASFAAKNVHEEVGFSRVKVASKSWQETF
jgi:hypothetical protein